MVFVLLCNWSRIGRAGGLDSALDEDRRRGRLEALPGVIQAARAALRAPLRS